MKDQSDEEFPQYVHITENRFLHRRHRKLKEEDVSICECVFDANNPESSCGDRCLNLLTSTECTPGYCPCGIYCKNQRFQRCHYGKTKLFNTNGRGSGLLAEESIKAGCFIVEYCGEVISWKEAKRRAHIYENLGLKDAYMISLDAHEAIDATKMGSLARFINHSCQPNCETRKWNVLGEVRVGIFAKDDIPIGFELAYNYNFEWFGGAKVRCLCGASSCCGFLGAKSRGFQEDTYLWEDDDDRYEVDTIPIYDSADDDPSAQLLKMEKSTYDVIDEKNGLSIIIASGRSCASPRLESTATVVETLDLVPVESALVSELKNEPYELESTTAVVESLDLVPVESALINEVKNETYEHLHDVQRPLPLKSACANHHKRSCPTGKLKNLPEKLLDVKFVAKMLQSEEAEEILTYEEIKNKAVSHLGCLYNEIRPAIEERESDTQDGVSTHVAEKWIRAFCAEMKSDFDLHSSIIKNIARRPK